MTPYAPLRPSGGNVFHDGLNPEVFQKGSFYQPSHPDEVARRREVVAPFISGDASPDELSLQAYQEWVELDWKAPHGTYEATERLMAKLFEEAGVELPQAHHDLGDAEVLDPHEFISEAGDALWCTTAVASNGGVDMMLAVRHYLRRWYLHPEAQGDITFGILRQKTSDHVPQQVVDPHLRAPDFEPDDYVPDIWAYLQWFAFTAGAALDRQYGYDDKPDKLALARFLEEITSVTSPSALKTLDKWAGMLWAAAGPGVLEVQNYIMEAYFRKISDELLAPLIGRGVVFLDYVAREHDQSLGEVAVENMRKISHRVVTNTIDKPDGPRSED